MKGAQVNREKESSAPSAPFFQKERREPFFCGSSSIQSKNAEHDPTNKTVVTGAVGTSSIKNSLVIQKKCAECEKEEKEEGSGVIQNKDDGYASMTTGSDAEPATNSPLTNPNAADAPTPGPAPIPAQASTTTGKFIVEDSETAAMGQMKKTEFLSRLKAEVCASVNEALAGSQFTSDNCPYIQAAFARHANSSPLELEQLMQRYAPATATALNAEGVIQHMKARVSEAAFQFVQTGGNLPGMMGVFGSMPGSLLSGASMLGQALGGMFFKAQPGGINSSVPSANSVMQNLGKGSTMPSSTKGRMESAFGTSFSDVQIHTDSKASEMSTQMNARAFTVGNHIAFGSGEHKPGTLEGDALMAHELAHVLQQGAGQANDVRNDDTNKNAYQKLEDDADSSAVNAVLSMNGQKGSKNALPKMKSKLGLSRCTKKKEPCSVGTRHITVDLIKLRGSSRTPSSDLAEANRIYSPCCVQFVIGQDQTVPNDVSDRWLGDTDLIVGPDCATVGSEEKVMYDGATALYGLSSRLRVFYVSTFSPKVAGGFSLPPACASGSYAPYVNHVIMNDSTPLSGLAHEFGHVLLNDLGHSSETNNLMLPGGGSVLNADQCKTLYNNV